MAKSIKNIAASVHQSLLNKAKNSSRPFNELLQHFAAHSFPLLEAGSQALCENRRHIGSEDFPLRCFHVVLKSKAFKRAGL